MSQAAVGVNLGLVILLVTAEVCILPIYVENMEFAFSNTEVVWVSHRGSTGSRAYLAAVKVLGKESQALQKGREQRGVRNNS